MKPFSRWIQSVRQKLRRRFTRKKGPPTSEDLQRIREELHPSQYRASSSSTPKEHFKSVADMLARGPHMKPLDVLHALNASKMGLNHFHPMAKHAYLFIYPIRLSVLRDSSLSRKQKLVAFSSRTGEAQLFLEAGNTILFDNLMNERIETYERHIQELSKRK